MDAYNQWLQIQENWMCFYSRGVWHQGFKEPQAQSIAGVQGTPCQLLWVTYSKYLTSFQNYSFNLALWNWYFLFMYINVCLWMGICPYNKNVLFIIYYLFNFFSSLQPSQPCPSYNDASITPLLSLYFSNPYIFAPLTSLIPLYP